ncbi:MAG: 4Fe-4S binding protein [Bacteroidetes bacterium]|nr:4Fe-4S binding protein [Bacteroidota bacterium]MBT6685185.1 4Fe-4S binding protein [Bacteroidota bacterium]MBT7144904.1 4Fe-4S binding protein [Bacteroidota bacterium]MBT7492668.1 4Fe-4S binding protein [Bacteroidota bacterium]
MNQEIKNIVDEIVNEMGKSVEMTIPILQEIQNKFNYLPEEALQRVCETTDISASRIFSVSTFYSQFRHKPVGKHIISVCVGTACHVKGAGLVYDAVERELKKRGNNQSDKNFLFTVEKVACLGCCTLAPVVQIDETTFGHVSVSQVPEILDEFLRSSKNKKPGFQKVVDQKDKTQGEIRIGLNSCCVASGSSDIKEEIEKTLVENNIDIDIKQVGCVGICNQVPLMEIHKENEAPTIYSKITADEVNEIILRHFKSKNYFTRLKSRINSFADNLSNVDIPERTKQYLASEKNTPISDFLDSQIHIATENSGQIDPVDILEYEKYGGFEALKKCLFQLSSSDIIDIVQKSGLKGRGGAGFSTGTKWKLVKENISDKKFVICNGDEGDPGAFMDRMLLESFPFRIIEGMIIASITIGAEICIFYIRAEYGLAVQRISQAIEICKQNNIIGKNILNSGFSVEVELFKGAGAFVCGEETALISSIEGERGFPKIRPPFPSEKGIYGFPTLINNTETFSLISWIIRNGSENFKNIGTKNSSGTKVFALAGKIKRGGLIEVPMGMSIKEIIENIGGGIANGKKFKAVQIGGPSGGCIPVHLAEIPIDYDSLTNAGSMMGSGGLIVLDEDDCMVDIAKYFLSFTQDQSCGKCTFCRIGTRRMLEILEKICSGKGKMNDLKILEELAIKTTKGSLCGLGKTASNPILSTLEYFRDEYEAHIHGKCPTGKCENMISYLVKENCIGCTKCAQKCPSDAILSVPYELHIIDPEKCIKCDICRLVCPTDSIVRK